MHRVSSVIIIILCLSWIPRQAYAQSEYVSAVASTTQLLNQVAVGSGLGVELTRYTDNRAYVVTCSGNSAISILLDAPGSGTNLSQTITCNGSSRFVNASFRIWLNYGSSESATVTVSVLNFDSRCFTQRLNADQATSINIAAGDARNLLSVEGHLIITNNDGIAIPSLNSSSGMPVFGATTVSIDNSQNLFNGNRPDVLISCPRAASTPTPTNSPTPTRSPTPTITPTPIPGITDGVCDVGDFLCNWGRGTEVNLSFSVTATSDLNIPLTATQSEILAEPGAWQLSANCTRTNGTSSTAEIVAMYLENPVNLYDIIGGDNIFPTSLVITYHVTLPPLSMYDYSQRSTMLRVVRGSGWDSNDEAACTLLFEKLANNNLTVLSATESRYTIYHGDKLWGDAEFDIGIAAPATLNVAQVVDTSWTPIYRENTLTNALFTVVGGTTAALNPGTYPTYTAHSRAETGAISIRVSTDRDNKTLYYIQSAQFPTTTPTRTNTTAPIVGTSTSTPTPTISADCVRRYYAPGSSTFAFYSASYVYVENGVLLVTYQSSGQTHLVDGSGFVYDGSVAEWQVGQIDHGTSLSVVFCSNIPPTATATATRSPTAPALPCPVADSISVPVAPGNISVQLVAGARFVVAGASVYFNIGAEAREIRPGAYSWGLAPGSYTAYSLTVVATIYLCVEATPTSTNTALATPTSGPPWAGSTPVACVPGQTPIPTISYSMPDLSLQVPTLIPLASATMAVTITLTATAGISTTAVVALWQTIEAGVRTPQAQISTAGAAYNWAAGAQLASTATSYGSTALDWLSITNPLNTGWQIEGGALWAMWPLLGPVLPIAAFYILMTAVRFLIYLLRALAALVDLIVKFFELLPGE